VLAEGDGHVDKGMKIEWATVKDGQLVLGSFGKEYTDEKGAIISTANNWIVTVDAEVRRCKRCCTYIHTVIKIRYIYIQCGDIQYNDAVQKW
jgi:Apyrase